MTSLARPRAGQHLLRAGPMSPRGLWGGLCRRQKEWVRLWSATGLGLGAAGSVS